jgi:hypothetical protein
MKKEDPTSSPGPLRSARPPETKGGRSQGEPEDSHQRIEEINESTPSPIMDFYKWYHVYCKEHLDQFAWLHIIIPGPFPLDFL